MNIELFDQQDDFAKPHHGIFLNSAGSSLMAKPVYEKWLEYTEQELSQGGYKAHELNLNQERDFYKNVAELINSNPEEIAFMESATRAWNIIFHSIGHKKDTTIITCESEYGSNFINYLLAKKRYGIQIKVIKNGLNGHIDLKELENSIDEKTSLIAITHIPTNNGLINPAEQVGKIAKKHSIPYLLDSCQAIGQIQVDVQKIGCDFLTATGRKYLRGPRGTGFLYICHKQIKEIEPIYLDIHSASWDSKDTYSLRADAKKFELWECSLANKIALSHAVRYALTIGMEHIESRVKSLASYLRKKLNQLDFIDVTDIGDDKCAIVTFYHKSISSKKLCQSLYEKGYTLSVSGVYSTRLDMESRNLPDLLRASIHYYNHESQIDSFVDALRSI